MPTTIRTLELLDIPVPVNIAHGFLPAFERVEDSDLSMERLHFSFSARLDGPAWLPQGEDAFQQILNYASIHRRLSAMHSQLLERPIESLLDALLSAIEAQAESLTPHGIRLLSVDAWVIRRDLIDGEIRASVRRDY